MKFSVDFKIHFPFGKYCNKKFGIKIWGGVNLLIFKKNRFLLF